MLVVGRSTRETYIKLLLNGAGKLVTSNIEKAGVLSVVFIYVFKGKLLSFYVKKKDRSKEWGIHGRGGTSSGSPVHTGHVHVNGFDRMHLRTSGIQYCENALFYFFLKIIEIREDPR